MELDSIVLLTLSHDDLRKWTRNSYLGSFHKGWFMSFTWHPQETSCHLKGF